MFSFFVSFLSCALLTLLVIKTARKHGLGLDGDFGGVQKVHSHAVARIGGIPIFLAVVVASGISILREPQMMAWLATLIACAAIALAGGIAEDYTGRVSPLRRLALTMVAAALGYWLVDARVGRLDPAGAGVHPLPIDHEVYTGIGDPQPALEGLAGRR